MVSRFHLYPHLEDSVLHWVSRGHSQWPVYSREQGGYPMCQAQLGLKLVQWTRFKWFQVLDPYLVISVSAFFLTDWIDPMSLLYQLMTTANNMNTKIPTTDLSWGSKTDFQCRKQITSSHFSEKLQDFTTLSLNYTKKLRGPWYHPKSKNQVPTNL